MNISEYGLPVSPFAVSETEAKKLRERPALRTKRWFRVIYRHFNGTKWSDWMRFHPEVDVKHPAFHGNFKTLKEAKDVVKVTMDRRARGRKRGYEIQDFGGLGVQFKTDKNEKEQYVIFEEMTVTLSETFVE